MEIVRDRSDTPGCTRASVYVSGQETVYTHSGRGRPVLLLSGDDSIRRRLATALSAVTRVIVPERIEGDDSTSTATWIRGILDGLGIEGVTLVSDERHGMPAIALALAEPFRVERVALLVEGESLVAGVGIEERFESTGQRLLLVGTADSPGSGAAWIARVTKLVCAADTAGS